MHNQTVNLQLYKENFTEHNFLWTQWKKNKHFSFLKPFVEPKDPTWDDQDKEAKTDNNSDKEQSQTKGAKEQSNNKATAAETIETSL